MDGWWFYNVHVLRQQLIAQGFTLSKVYLGVWLQLKLGILLVKGITAEHLLQEHVSYHRMARYLLYLDRTMHKTEGSETQFNPKQLGMEKIS